MSELKRVELIVDEGADEGLHIGFLLSVRLGSDHYEWAFGDAAPGIDMSVDTLMMWASSSKPITGVAVLRQWEGGQLDLDDPVSRYLPEMQANVTIRQVLTHTAGIRPLGEYTEWDDTIAKICSAPLVDGWVPGKRAAYSPSSGAFLLAEIVRRITAMPFADYVREAIFEPLGMHESWMALSPERHAAYGRRIGVMHNTQRTPPIPIGWDSPEVASRCIPGGSGRGPVRELSLFYERIPLLPQTLAAMVARQRTGLMDETFRAMMDWGLFVIPSTPNAPYGYGAHASAKTFGHGGFQSSVGFRDPARDLAVAMIFNGAPGEGPHSKRQHAVCTALYEDLGLA